MPYRGGAEAVYGEPETLTLILKVSGHRLCGAYIPVYRGAMGVMAGELHVQ